MSHQGLIVDLANLEILRKVECMSLKEDMEKGGNSLKNSSYRGKVRKIKCLQQFEIEQDRA